jgi:hypothetical protein
VKISNSRIGVSVAEFTRLFDGDLPPKFYPIPASFSNPWAIAKTVNNASIQ